MGKAYQSGKKLAKWRKIMKKWKMQIKCEKLNKMGNG